MCQGFCLNSTCISVPDWYKISTIVDIARMRYNLIIAAPKLVAERGALFEYTFNSCNLRYGDCNRVLRLQVAERKYVTATSPVVT